MTKLTNRQKLDRFEKDLKDRHDYVEKQNNALKENASKIEKEDFELQENTFENVVRSLERIEKPTHRSSFTFPWPLYPGQKK